MRIVPRGRVVALNRRAWNGIAAAWGARAEQRRAIRSVRRRPGGTLWPVERTLLGPVKGKTLLHLLCGEGEDTLSWAALGARVTGVDLADRRIALARGHAARLGLPASFVAADATRLPLRRASFDLAYTSRGALVWLPDLSRWAREVARVLKPGGRFLICDEHPFLYCLVQRGRGAPVAGWNYFDQRPRAWRGWWFLKRSGRDTIKAETDWKLSDALNALTGAGLVLVTARELPEAAAMDFRMPQGRHGWLPQTLVTLWEKPRGARARGL